MSLLSSARVMAVGTVASRATGFLRTAVLAAVLGVASVGDAFNVANTAPNIVYELLLGGILTSVVVPLLVRASRDGVEQGRAYAQRLLTLTLFGLGGAVLLLVLAAPLLIGVYQRSGTPTYDLAVLLARFFLPQVLFYGLGAVMGAWLNTQGVYGAPMWAPVLNNLVVVATGLLFLLVPGPARLTAGTITPTQTTVLGVGVTLGILVQTLALVPSLRATGLSLRPRFDLRGTGLRQAGRLARWTGVFVVGNQVSIAVVVRLAGGHGVDGRGYTAYVSAFVLWQLPHAVVAVSLITALLPAMSRAAADGRTDELRRRLDEGLRLSVSILVPAAVALVVLGRPVSVLVFAHGRTTGDQARFIGDVLAVMAVGLVAFSAYQLQARAFYALQDTRTPALVNLAVNGSAIVVDLVLYAVLPPDLTVLGLAAGQSGSYLLGAALCTRVLARRVPHDPAGHVLRTTVRCLLAATAPALGALLVVVLADRVAGHGLLATLAGGGLAGAVLVGGYVALARRVRVPEVAVLIDPVLSRLGARR